MENFPAGTRVFFWNKTGKAIYATVEQVVRASDGTVVVHLNDDSGQRISLPKIGDEGVRLSIRAQFKLIKRKKTVGSDGTDYVLSWTQTRIFPSNLASGLPSRVSVRSKNADRSNC
ncbi:hypothetical protein C8R45DRAFT_294910 [Mycena sanguinolenta]|nr:hypothetical protein C8R45DRAFT_294910 [Mycena sanguinolenta]